MQFLNPIFLVGLAAAAIPILLHLLSRRHLIDIPFAPLRFLVPTQERQMRRLSLRRLLLLILRVAIISLVVMALARPTLTGGLASLVHSGQTTSALILVDASASMQAQVTGGTVFDRARQEAQAIAGELGSGDELAVALFTDSIHPLFGEFVRDPGLVLAELGEAAPTYRPSDYVAALEGALDFLQRSTRDHREIYVVSDFQQATPDTTRLAHLQRRLAASPPTNVFLRRVETEPFVNRQVVDVERPATLLRSGQTAQVVVTARQDGDAPLPVQLFLQVGETTVGETELELAPSGSLQHEFALTLPQAGDLGGSSRLRPDRYPPDDERFFVLSVLEQVPVLVLKGVEGGEGERDPLLFLLAALDPNGRGEGSFHVEVAAGDQFDVTHLPGSHVVIATNVHDIGAARLAALTEYLQGGGTLLLFVGDPRVRTYTNEKLLPAWTDARLGSFRGDADVHERLEVVSRDHPVFAGFDDDEIATLEEVKLRNFFRLPDDIGRPLIRFADGGAAVLELEVGKGRLVLCGFHTSAASGDLPYSPMFLPLVQRLTGYLATAGWGRFGRQFDVGSKLVVEAPNDATPATAYHVRVPGGELQPASLDASATPARVEFEGAEVPGIYAFLRDGEPWALCAVNVPAAESNRTFQTAEAFRGQFGEAAISRLRALSGDATGEAVREARSGRGIHRLFLAIAGLLLVVESFLSRRVAPA
jgi:hypothetical protein